MYCLTSLFTKEERRSEPSVEVGHLSARLGLGMDGKRGPEHRAAESVPSRQGPPGEAPRPPPLLLPLLPHLLLRFTCSRHVPGPYLPAPSRLRGLEYRVSL